MDDIYIAPSSRLKDFTANPAFQRRLPATTQKATVLTTHKAVDHAKGWLQKGSEVKTRKEKPAWTLHPRNGREDICILTEYKRKVFVPRYLLTPAASLRTTVSAPAPPIHRKRLLEFDAVEEPIGRRRLRGIDNRRYMAWSRLDTGLGPHSEAPGAFASGREKLPVFLNGELRPAKRPANISSLYVQCTLEPQGTEASGHPGLDQHAKRGGRGTIE
ncbi:hypothetical protein CLCR_05140 [Cladophialophora carrionii]|uniref:Uncharacterized protein n=1 Tax=Cladophialophora carrionii TaxID=86049 RepID=A0A1C1CKV7_9EURO|nr:hypothetical protein CLCR_05140 [Cladophialophora carrionii]